MAGLPFVILLLTIALAPLVRPAWWHKNRNKTLVALAVSIPVAIYLGIAAPHILAEKLREYFGFIVVIGALFVITGGIHIQGSLSGTPLLNTSMLGLGAILANLLGTTGASVLLIRPLLRANKARKRVSHIVIFFIFIVANCGGLLTPIGDPPLLLGFLKGVPFYWTLQLWPQWLLANGILLMVFGVLDWLALNKDERELPGSQHEQVLVHEPLRVRGALSIIGLIGVLATILCSGIATSRGTPWDPGLQEIAIVIIAVIAFLGTPRENRERNAFTFAPIIEVAVLFAGIFITMAPVLEMLNIWAASPSFVLSKPAHFFWATGTLSSVLDNAPTYLVFAASAAGLQGLTPHGPYIGALVLDPGSAKLLAAISTGAVFMGANTYIGNAPNFMVRAIAEESGVKMPSFFGYLGYSVAILVPMYVAVALIFF